MPHIEAEDAVQRQQHHIRGIRWWILLWRRIGTKNLLLFLLKGYVLYRMLYYIFGFDKWHVFNTYENTPYKRESARKVNELHPSVVVEIGCGLGEIISRIRAQTRIGVDTDENVIKAAKLLHRRKPITFLNGSFSTIRNRSERTIDVLLMLNWLHNYPESYVAGEIARLLECKTVSYLVVDEILGGLDGYAYHHNFTSAFQKDFRQYQLMDDGEGVRRILILQRIATG
jgi:hypothetical protein